MTDLVELLNYRTDIGDRLKDVYMALGGANILRAVLTKRAPRR